MQVILHSVSSETEDIKTFRFDSEEPLDYIAGHFVELTVPHDHPDAKGTRRWFTLSSSPGEPQLAVTIRCRSGSSYKQALQTLAPGSQLTMSEPMGDFVLPLNDSIPLVWLAGGIGITPFRSMAKWLADNHERRTVSLFQAVSNPSEAVLFKDVFQAAGVEDHRFIGPDDRQQLTTSQDLLGKLGQRPMWFVSGPEPFVQSVTRSLRAAGVGMQDIVTDEFLGYH